MPVAAPIIGAAGSLGAAALSKPKSQKDPLAPYLKDAASQAQQLYQQGPVQQYQGSGVSPFSDTTNQALRGILARAQAGSPLVSSAQNYVQQGLNAPITSGFGGMQNPYSNAITVGGGPNPYAAPVSAGQEANPYASGPNPFGGTSNPYLDAAFNQAAQRSQSTLESEFARGGRNIGAAAPARADMLSNLATQIYAPAYESERNRQLAYGQQQLGIGADSFNQQQGRQLQAGLAGQQIGAQGYENLQNRQLQAGLQGQQIGAQGYENAQNRQLQDLTSQRGFQQNLLGYASPLAAQDYADLAAQQGVGQAYDAQSQAQLTDAINRFNTNANAPGQALNDYINRLQGIHGGSTPVPPAYQQNVVGTALGGALLGQQLYDNYKQTQPPVIQFNPMMTFGGYNPNAANSPWSYQNIVGG